MCEVASFKNFQNSLTTVKVMTKIKVAPFYLGHGVDSLLWGSTVGCHSDSLASCLQLVCGCVLSTIY